MNTSGEVLNQYLADSQVQRTLAVVMAVVESHIGWLILSQKTGKCGFIKDKQAKRGWDQHLRIYLTKGLIGYPSTCPNWLSFSLRSGLHVKDSNVQLFTHFSWFLQGIMQNVGPTRHREFPLGHKGTNKRFAHWEITGAHLPEGLGQWSQWPG